MPHELSYKYATEEHKERVLDFLIQYFMREEPITKALGGQREDLAPVFQEMIDEAVKYPVSIVVFNEAGEIVAVRLSTVINMEQKRRYSDSQPSVEAFKSYTQITCDILNFLDRLELGMAETVPLTECQLVLKFLIVSVRPDYYRQGIAETSIDMSLDRGKEQGCTAVTVTATAIKSQILFQMKLGFHTLRVVEHENYLRDNGDQIFKCTDGTTCGKLMFKIIK